MARKDLVCFVLGVASAAWSIACDPAMPPPEVVVIANADTPMLDAATLQKVYLGKVVEVNGRRVVPVNLAQGTTVREQFMKEYLAQEDDKFVAYWTVRRYIGKGSPPKEFTSVESQLEYLRNTPGAVGYVDADVAAKAGLKTLFKRP